MTRVVHLEDDAGVGGVNSWLDAQLPRLDSALIHERLFVDLTRELPPALAADVIIIHFTMSWKKLAWFFGLRARNRHSAIILVEHSYTRAFETLNVPHTARFRAMLRSAYALVDQVVAVSEHQNDWIAEATGVPVAKRRVINPLTDIDVLRQLPLPGPRKGPLRLCGFGRYSPQKGFEHLVAAMRLIPLEIATLRLVGYGPLEPMLTGLALGLPHVSVEGPMSGPLALFASVDAIIIPSRFEAFGCVAAEARAAARPMIVTTVDGLNDHPVAAPQLRVPTNDPISLAGAITWLASQDLTTLGASARQSIVAAEQHSTDAWNGLLAEVTGRAPARSRLKPATPLPPARGTLEDCFS